MGCGSARLATQSKRLENKVECQAGRGQTVVRGIDAPCLVFTETFVFLQPGKILFSFVAVGDCSKRLLFNYVGACFKFIFMVSLLLTVVPVNFTKACN